VSRARLVVLALLAVALVWLGFRAVRAFDQDRHAADATAVLTAPGKVTYRLAPVPASPRAPGAPGTPGRAAASPADVGAPEREGSPQLEEPLGGVHSPDASPNPSHSPNPNPNLDSSSDPSLDPGGRFSYRPGTWLSVVDLEGLEPVTGDERYLVFLRNWAGWTLAGAARPGAGGDAQVRSGAEPRPPTIYEVVVTRAVDDATSIPHGEPVLHWFDGSLGPPRARPFDFAKGV
jgi:hypothetical protein